MGAHALRRKNGRPNAHRRSLGGGFAVSDWVPTTCMRCAVGCGHLQRGVDVGYGLDTVRGDATHPVNQGLACQRGVSETADPEGEWLNRPLVRRDGELVPTTWDVALARVIEQFSAALDASPDSVAVLGSGQQTNESAYALGKLARGGFGTRYYDANTTLCMASAVTAYYDAFGSDAPPCTYEDIPDAERHVVWGANPAVAHPVMFRWIAQAANEDGKEMVVVDPVETQTAEKADTHVSPEPGGDLALARAVLARVVETDRVDEAFVAEATTGFDDLVADLPDPEDAAAEAGVPMEQVDLLADAFDHKTLVYWGMGVNQSVQGTDTAGALIDCCLATGNLRPGSGPFSLTGQANSMGTRVCSSKGGWPGQRDFDDPAARADVADEWGVPVERLPDDTGPGPVGTVEDIADGPIEAVYAVATNPAAGMPHATTVEENLEDAFLVVQDAFMTETAELADVVLPAATWGETEGTTMNMERTVSRVRAASEVPRGVRTDLDIITTLGNRLADGLFGDATSPESVFEEFVGLTEGTMADCSGISYERLEEESAVRWPAPSPEEGGGYRYYEGAETVEVAPDGGTEPEPAAASDEGWSFPTPSGRARFAGGEGRALPETPDDDYPLTLTTAREADGYNTGVRSRERDPEPPVARVHPETVARYGDALAGEANATRIESRRAGIEARVEPDETVPEGMVWLSIHHPATNDLTTPERDPDSDEPNFKQCAVRFRDGT